MKYNKIVKGIFIDRPNRFIAHVLIQETEYTVHVKNTGRCKELLIKGCTVYLEESDNPLRKTKFDLIAVIKKTEDNKELLINIDSQAPNKVVMEWLKKQDYTFIKPEYTYGKSRVDFFMQKQNQDFLLEVKGCTLEKNGTGYFPDAPTERGVKHLMELAGASRKGIKCFIAFVIQIPGVTIVKPNIETHPEFGKALEQAVKDGVKVLYLPCKVTPDSLEIIN